MKKREKTTCSNKAISQDLSIVHDVLIIIGPPCTGKTTFVSDVHHDSFIISSDNIVDQLCEQHNLTYSEFFQLAFNHPIRKKQRKLFDKAIEESKNHQKIVWDLTNLTKRERARAMVHYPRAAFRAVEVEFKGWEKEIIKLNHERGLRTGKIVPEHVLLNMFKRYESVSKEEGFTEITKTNVISSIIALQNAA